MSQNSQPSENNTNGQIPDLMTEAELIQYLRIPEVSNAKDSHNVIENLKRMRELPRMHISNKPLFPLKAIKEWIDQKTTEGRQ